VAPVISVCSLTRACQCRHRSDGNPLSFLINFTADLEAAGADVWVDDARITSDDFIKKINEGLAGRQWLVLVMTPDALRSQ
jgi:hypothetical protein